LVELAFRDSEKNTYLGGYYGRKGLKKEYLVIEACSDKEY